MERPRMSAHVFRLDCKKASLTKHATTVREWRP